MTPAVLVRDFTAPGRPNALGFPQRYVRLHGTPELELSVLHEYDLGEEAGSWLVRSVAYWYQVRQVTGSEIIAFHWHPRASGGGVRFPHLHLGRAIGPIAIAPKAHVPTGRVSLEAVVAFLIRDLGVRPLRPNWEPVRAANQAAFDAKRTW